MSWKNTIKKEENRNFADSDRDGMEEEAANSHNPERHMNETIKDIVGNNFGNGLVADLGQRLSDSAEPEHITYKEISLKELRAALLPVIEKLVKDSFEFDMSKYKYSGP